MRSASNRLLAVPDHTDLETRAPNWVQGQITRGVEQSQEESTCGRCFGAGLEVVAGRGARRCACRLGDLHRRLFEQARIPKRHETCSLSNYQPAADNVS